VFGKIKTPFKKQQLVNDLETFLMRQDIQKTIAAYIDEDDAKIIAAVALFGEPVCGELESFFSGEFSCARLQDIIVNLEERFILYRFNDEKEKGLPGLRYIALNPVLEKILLPFTANTALLFPAAETGGGETEEQSASAPQTQNCFDDRILAGLLSFVSTEERFYKSEGLLRKKIVDAGMACFPGLDLERILGALQILGLFYVSGDRLAADKRYFDSFGLLSQRERSEYCAAALLEYSNLSAQTEILAPLFRNRIKDLVDFIHSFLDSLKKDGCKYHEQSLKRLIEILKAKTGTDVEASSLLGALEEAGLITGVSPQLKQIPLPSAPKAGTERPCIAIDSSYSVFVYPEIDYKDLISLSSFLTIKLADTASGSAAIRFDMDKDSAVRAFDNNMKADDIAALLNRLSGNRVSETLLWNLKDWEKRYGEVSLKKGVILTLAEDRRYLVETKALASLISETLAPGVYLLNSVMDEAAAALRDAGIDIIAKMNPLGGAVSESKTALKYFPPPCGGTSHSIDYHSRQNPSVYEGASPLTKQFHAILEKIPVDKAARAELAARIDRRLILCESQLKEAVVRYEKLEARLMDYAGKQNLAKQAVAQQSNVEIEWQGEKIFGIASAIEKNNGEYFLIVSSADGQAAPSQNVKVPLAKISLLRRIKKSIFET
jgi:hypothetical protein